MNIEITKFRQPLLMRQQHLSIIFALGLGVALACGVTPPAQAQEALNDLASQQPAPLMVPEAMPAAEPALPPVVGVPSPAAPPADITTPAPVAAPAPVMPEITAETTATADVAPAAVAVPTKPTVTPTTLPNAPANTPTVVTEVVGKLQQTQNNISLEDMAKAQDALARLDLLLEIEQKLGEIKNAQDQRAEKANRSNRQLGSGGGTGSAGVGSIPASALALPLPPAAVRQAIQQQAMMPPARPVSPAVAEARDYKVEQIGGTNGNFTATLVTPSGTKRPVKRGDEFSGVTVVDITARGVTLKTAKGVQTIAVDADGLELAPKGLVR